MDFNLFGPEREGRAVELLSSNGVRLSNTPDPNAPANLLPRTEPARIFDYVLVYLTVALGDQFAAGRPTGSGISTLRALAEAYRSGAFQESVIAAFGPSAAPWMDTPDQAVRGQADAGTRVVAVPGFQQVLVAPGCLEMTSKDAVFLMFKTNWSRARLLPRCGVPR